MGRPQPYNIALVSIPPTSCSRLRAAFPQQCVLSSRRHVVVPIVLVCLCAVLLATVDMFGGHLLRASRALSLHGCFYNMDVVHIIREASVPDHAPLQHGSQGLTDVRTSTACTTCRSAHALADPRRRISACVLQQQAPSVEQ